MRLRKGEKEEKKITSILVGAIKALLSSILLRVLVLHLSHSFLCLLKDFTSPGLTLAWYSGSGQGNRNNPSLHFLEINPTAVDVVKPHSLNPRFYIYDSYSYSSQRLQQ